MELGLFGFGVLFMVCFRLLFGVGFGSSQLFDGFV